MTHPSNRLTVVDPLTQDRHDRDAIGMRYVYPVVSRRAKGVSIGINLNDNNACNWRCAYCQVPNLTRGRAPSVDLGLLESELLTFTQELTHGDFLEQHVPEGARVLKDFALSGNGEPTSSPQFAEALEVIARVRATHARLADLPIVLITNGSLADRNHVKIALARLGQIGGVIWFKLDRGTDAGLRATNSTTTRLARHIARLEAVANLCPTWIQSCWFRRHGLDPAPEETSAFLDVLTGLFERNVPLRGVQLYTLARQPQQPEGVELDAVTEEWLRHLGGRIERCGFPVIVAP